MLSTKRRQVCSLGDKASVRYDGIVSPGPAVLPLPRGVLTTAVGPCEWTSALVLPYQRRLREVNEAMLATYPVGGQHPATSGRDGEAA